MASLVATAALAGFRDGPDSPADRLLVMVVAGWVLSLAFFHYRLYYIAAYAPLLFLALSRVVVHALSGLTKQAGRSVFLLLLLGFPPALWSLSNLDLAGNSARGVMLGGIALLGGALVLGKRRASRMGTWLAGAAAGLMLASPFLTPAGSFEQLVRGRFLGTAYWNNTRIPAEISAAANFLTEKRDGSYSVVADALVLAQLPPEISRRSRPRNWAPSWSARYPDYVVVDSAWSSQYANRIPPQVAGWTEVFRSGAVAVYRNPLTTP